MTALRVLVIDDQKQMLTTLGNLLRRAGHEVVLANSGREGLSRIAENDIEVLITDMLMPDMDGIEVIKTLRVKHPGLWIVAMSGGGRMLSANVALTLSRAFGADRVLYKPFRTAELLAALERDET